MEQAATASPSRRVLAAVAAAAGNTFEYYDFAVYGYVAAMIGRTFFPAQDPVTSLLSAFAVFGVGFLARPLGGILIGRFADLRGRKPALVLCIFMMAVGTLLTGLVPGYARIGVAAPVLIVLARLIQGISIGGGAGSSMAFIVEWAPEGRRGFFGSLQQCSSTAGFLLGSCIAALSSSLLSTAQFGAWGWRIPFLVGVLIAPIGLFIQRYIDETPAFTNASASRAASSTRSGAASSRATSATTRSTTTPPAVNGIARSRLRATADVFGLTILWTVAFYVFLTYMPTFTRLHAGLQASQALWANTIGLVGVVISIPLVGALSDRIGRRPILLVACVAFLVLPYPLLGVMLAAPPFIVTVLVQVVFGIMLALLCGTCPAATTEMFSTANRTTLMSVGYSLSVAVFGGFAPYIATWLTQHTGSPLSPAWYIAASAVITFIVVLNLRETAHTPLT